MLWATGALVGIVALVGGIVAISTVTDGSTRGTARVGVSLASAPANDKKPTTPARQKLPPLKVQPVDALTSTGPT